MRKIPHTSARISRRRAGGGNAREDVGKGVGRWRGWLRGGLVGAVSTGRVMTGGRMFGWRRCSEVFDFFEGAG